MNYFVVTFFLLLYVHKMQKRDRITHSRRATKKRIIRSQFCEKYFDIAPVNNGLCQPVPCSFGAGGKWRFEYIVHLLFWRSCLPNLGTRRRSRYVRWPSGGYPLHMMYISFNYYLCCLACSLLETRKLITSPTVCCAAAPVTTEVGYTSWRLVILCFG